MLMEKLTQVQKEKRRAEIIDALQDRMYDNTLIIDGEEYDGAIIGIDDDSERLVYDYDKLVEITMDNSNPRMTWEEAAEYVDYNIIGAKSMYSPIIMNKLW